MENFRITVLAICSGFLLPAAMSCDSVNNNLGDGTSGNIVILDAGSSGTRAFVYQWKKASAKAIADVEIATSNGERLEKRIKPGIQEQPPTKEALQAYLKPLVDFIVESLGAEKAAQTSVFLKATGGARSLSAAQQKALVAAAQQALDETPFNKAEAEIITGSQEGVFAWVSVNTALDNFEVTDDNYDTGGIIELGGASLLIDPLAVLYLILPKASPIGRKRWPKYCLATNIVPFPLIQQQ